MNIMPGPHKKAIQDLFNSKTELPESMYGFVEGLLPANPSGFKSKYVPVEAFMCHIPNIHNDLHVLLAIATTANSEIFAKDGCRAIINWMWLGERWTARFRMTLAILELVNFMCFNLLFDEVGKMGEDFHISQLFLGCISILIWSLAVFFEVMQCRGYLLYG